MAHSALATDALNSFAHAAHLYLSETEEYRAQCMKHAKTAAIHTRGNELQVYRMFKRDEATARHMHEAAKSLPSWEESPHWKSQKDEWKRIATNVTKRMERHSEQHPIITKGIVINGVPMLIHAYKFEPDPTMKLELVLPEYPGSDAEMPLKRIATALEGHERLVPQFIASAIPPYSHHEARFLTLGEYLTDKMPSSLYATQCIDSLVYKPDEVSGEGVSHFS
jgi:hypothetical protein